MFGHFLIDSINSLIFPSLIVIHCSAAVIRHENPGDTAKVFIHVDMRSDP